MLLLRVRLAHDLGRFPASETRGMNTFLASSPLILVWPLLERVFLLASREYD